MQHLHFTSYFQAIHRRWEQRYRSVRKQLRWNWWVSGLAILDRNCYCKRWSVQSLGMDRWLCVFYVQRPISIVWLDHCWCNVLPHPSQCRFVLSTVNIVWFWDWIKMWWISIVIPLVWWHSSWMAISFHKQRSRLELVRYGKFDGDRTIGACFRSIQLVRIGR